MTARSLGFEVNEGTWMSVDIAPEGRSLYFDLLGHIYRIPSKGGSAECLTCASGSSMNFHPRISPGGDAVAFISDRSGQNNLWLMNADGGDVRPVALKADSRMMEPVWTPDGRFLIVRESNYGQAIFSAALTMYPRDGGAGVNLLPPDPQAPGWPSVTPDGRFVYYHVFAGKVDLRTFGSADVLRGDWQLRRLELANGQVVEITSGQAAPQFRTSSGGAYAPGVSPDGEWLAFARRIPDGTISFRGHAVGPRTALWLRNLETGRERLLMDPIELDVAEEFLRSMRVLPGYSWSPDSASIFVAQGGRIRRVDVESGETDLVPFKASVRRNLAELAYRRVSIPDEPLNAKFIRWPAVSPAGDQVVFEALGKLWIADLPGGEPRRLTGSLREEREVTPSWSPDGRWVVFAAWNEVDGGSIWKVEPGGKQPVSIVTDPGEYLHPSFDQDAKWIVATRGPGVTARGRGLASAAWFDIVRFPSAGGSPQRVLTVPGAPRRGHVVRAFTGPDDRLFVTEEDREGIALVSVSAEGGDRKVHAVAQHALDIVPSPDRRWIAVSAQANVFVAPFPSTVSRMHFGREESETPYLRISDAGGLFPHWFSGTRVAFSNGAELSVADVESGRKNDYRLALTAPRRRPDKSIALTNAKIISQGSAGVVDSGTIVVDGGRLSCIGECAIDAVDRVLDLAGNTIIPGLIDAHAHHHREDAGLTPLRSFEAASYLAYGVTTTFDPAPVMMNMGAQAELIETGGLIGPRMFYGGEVINVAPSNVNEGIASQEAADREVRRRIAWGATSVKLSILVNRRQAQWVVNAARRAGITAVAETLGDLEHQIALTIDGYSGFTHPAAIVPLHQDATTFLGNAGIGYTPTFVFGGPGPWAEDFFYQKREVWLDPKQRVWIPWRQLMPHLRRRTLRPESDYPFTLEAEALADVIASGGYGAIGSHGQQHGIGSHWEIWAAGSALEPLQALRTATIDAARFVGIHEDTGSLECGKLADLVVLKADPLADLENSLSIRYVMKDGVLYEGETLDEVWPTSRPFGPRSWVDPDMLQIGSKSTAR